MKSCHLLSYLLPGLFALCIAPLNSTANDVAGLPFRVLVFSRTLGYRHTSITNGIAAVRDLGAGHNFVVDATEDSSAFTATNLARYKEVVLLSVTGEVWNPEQKEAFKQYILNGGGVAVIHGAVFGPKACEDHWAWYGQMFCCAFTNHSRVVPAVVKIEDGTHPSTSGLPGRWERTDEWYNFTGTPRGCARVLATVDETTYHGGTMGSDHPIAWCQSVGKGRMWYTAMGHTESSFNEPLLLQHLLGGIMYVAGNQPSDGKPTQTSDVALAWKQEAGTFALLQGASVVWQFNFGTNAPKPFFHPLALLDGTVLTVNQPPDHPWHHGMWFSWKFINGVNYWEGPSTLGNAAGLTEWSAPKINTRPDFSARIALNLLYRPAAGKPVLAEKRVIEVSPPGPDGSYFLDWTMAFTPVDRDVLLDRTPLPGEPDGKSWGGYAGLSVRFVKEMTNLGLATAEGPVAFTNNVYRGKAMGLDLSGLFVDREAGIAMLDSLDNLNSPGPWYSTDNGRLNYINAALIQFHSHTIKAGQTLTLRYRAIVHPGRWNAGQLRDASDQFVSSKKH